MNAALVVEIYVPGGVAWLATADAWVKVQPLPGVTSGHLGLITTIKLEIYNTAHNVIEIQAPSVITLGQTLICNISK